jgi:hypothetical protein
MSEDGHVTGPMYRRASIQLAASGGTSYQPQAPRLDRPLLVRADEI